MIPGVVAAAGGAGGGGGPTATGYDVDLFDPSGGAVDGFLYKFLTSWTFTDASKTTEVATPGDLIYVTENLVSPVEDALQSSSTARPSWETDVARFDGTADRLITTMVPDAVGGSFVARIRADLASSGTETIVGSINGTPFDRAWISLVDGVASMGLGQIASSDFQDGASTDLRSATEFVTIAGTWDANDIRLYVDGVEVNHVGKNASASLQAAYIGARNANGTADLFLDGDIDNVLMIDRVLDNDEIINVTSYWNPNLVFMSRFEGVDTATTAIDDSPSEHVMTFVGNAQIDTAQKARGSSSLLLDGTGDYITVPDSADFNFGSGDFTVEGQFRWNTDPADFQCLVGQYDSSVNQIGWALFRDQVGSKLQLWSSTAGSSATLLLSVTWDPVIGTWYHLAGDWDGTTYRLYADGKLLGTATTAVTQHDSTVNMSIGAQADGTHPFDGWIDNVKIYKGEAVYAGAFNPPIPNFKPHRYWRVLCIESQNVSYYAISELEFRESVGGADTTTSAQEIHTAERVGFEGTKAFDNIHSNSDNNSWGASDAASEAVGQDYGATEANWKDVVEITVRARDDSFYDQCPREFKLQYSDDNVTWITKFWVENEANWSQNEVRTYS